MITRRKFTLAGLLAALGVAARQPHIVEAVPVSPPGRRPPPKKPNAMPTLVVTRGRDYIQRTYPTNANGTVVDPTLGSAKLSAKDKSDTNAILPDATCTAGLDATNGNVFYVDIAWTHAQTLQYGAINQPVTFGNADLVWTVASGGAEYPLGSFDVQVKPSPTGV